MSLENACRHTPEKGAVRIVVKGAFEGAKENSFAKPVVNRLQIEVRDSGPGLPQAAREFIGQTLEAREPKTAEAGGIEEVATAPDAIRITFLSSEMESTGFRVFQDVYCGAADVLERYEPSR